MKEDKPSRRHLSRTAFELKRILTDSSQRCSVCQLVAHALRLRVDSLFYENVNDGPTREGIRKAGGFCRHHAHLIAKQADALGSALIFKDVLLSELRSIRAGKVGTSSTTPGPLGRLFDQPTAAKDLGSPCPLCKTEKLAVESLLEALEDPSFQEVFRQSIGLCLPHFRLAFERSGNQETWNKVLKKEIRVLEELAEELAELARKYDYQFKGEPRGAESDSWKRALHLTSGWPGE